MKRRRAVGSPRARERSPPAAPFRSYALQPALVDWRTGRVLAVQWVLVHSVGFIHAFGNLA